jgi:hypothetical protein
MLFWLGLAVALRFASRTNRFTGALLLCFVVSIFGVTKLFPLSALFSIPPFSQVQAIYLVPEYVLFASIISALGIDCLIADPDHRSRADKARTGWFGIALPAVLLMLCLQHFESSHFRFYQTAEVCAPNCKLWLLNVLSSLVILPMWLVSAGKSIQIRAVATTGLVLAGIASLMTLSYCSLPLRPSFGYPKILPMDFASRGRVVSIGDHLWRPNTNLIYGSSDIQVHNPLIPRGIGEFMRACGARTDEFSQYFPSAIAALTDLAGVRTVLSEQPLFDEDTVATLVKPRGVDAIPLEYSHSLSFHDIRMLRDDGAGTLTCRLEAVGKSPRSDDYSLCFRLEDLRGTPLSFIEPQTLVSSLDAQTITCSAFLPPGQKDWRLTMQIVRDKDGRLIRPTQVPFGEVSSNGAWVLATCDTPGRFINVTSTRFKIRCRYRSILAYENKTALNRHFFVRQIRWASQREDALNFMKLHAGELGSLAVLEDAQKVQFERCLSVMQSSRGQSITNFDQSGTIRELKKTSDAYNWTSSSGLQLQVENKYRALLVISDLYYPGWKVFLDGHEWPMFRADYLFRAVLVPPGVHQVRFIYQPISFVIGLTIFGLTVTVLLCLGLKDLASNKCGVKSVQEI